MSFLYQFHHWEHQIKEATSNTNNRKSQTNYLKYMENCADPRHWSNNSFTRHKALLDDLQGFALHEEDLQVKTPNSEATRWKERYMQLQKELNNVKAQLVTLNQKVKDYNVRESRFRRLSVEMSSDVNDAKGQKEHLERLLQGVRNELELVKRNSDDALQKLKDEHASKIRKFEALDKQLQADDEEATKLLIKYKNQECQFPAMEKELNELKQKLREELQDRRKSIDIEKRYKEQEAIYIAEFEEKLRMSILENEENIRIQMEFDELIKENERKIDELNAELSKYRRQSEQIPGLKKELVELREKVQEYEKQLEGLPKVIEEIDNVEKRTQLSDNIMKREMRYKLTEIQDLKDEEIDSLRREREQLMRKSVDDASRHENQRKQYEQQLSEKGNEVTQLTAKMAVLNDKFKQEKQDIKTRMMEVEEQLKNEVEELKRKLNEAKKQINDHKLAAESHDTQLDRLQEERMSKYKREVVDLKNDIESIKKTNEKVLEKLDASKEQNNQEKFRLQKDIADLTNQLDVSNKVAREKNIELEKLKEELSKAINDLEKSTQGLVELEAERETLLHTIAVMRKELAVSKKSQDIDPTHNHEEINNELVFNMKRRIKELESDLEVALRNAQESTKSKESEVAGVREEFAADESELGELRKQKLSNEMMKAAIRKQSALLSMEQEKCEQLSRQLKQLTGSNLAKVKCDDTTCVCHDIGSNNIHGNLDGDIILRIINKNVDNLTFNEVVQLHEAAKGFLKIKMVVGQVDISTVPPISRSIASTTPREKENILKNIEVAERAIQNKLNETKNDDNKSEVALKTVEKLKKYARDNPPSSTRKSPKVKPTPRKL